MTLDLAKLAQLTDTELRLVLSSMDNEALQQLAFTGRAAKAAGEVSEEGFADFYFCIMGMEMPPYVRNVWTPKLIHAYKTKAGVLLEAFRGSTKSTTLLVWVLYLIGQRPQGSSVFVRISQDAAMESGNAIAAIIEVHKGWKAVFPNVVPDTQRGWSSKGYFVKDTRMEYNDWVGLCVSDHLGEPSLMATGIDGGSIIGKHPSNGMYFDDLINEDASNSDREMSKLVRKFQADIIPTWTRPNGHPTLGVACTLWSEKDVYHAMLATNLFEHVITPIIYDSPDGEDFMSRKVKSVWDSAYPISKIAEIYKGNPLQFQRAYLCDLSAMKGIALKKEWLHEYPNEKITQNMPYYFGIDFASTEDKLRDKDRDYFALAIGAAIPSGGVILVGGFRDKISTGEALEKVKALASIYNPITIGVEKYGKGEEFMKQLLYSTNLPILPMPLRGAVVTGKGKRFQEGLAPMFMTSRAWINDVPDPFITAFYDEWVGWDGGRSRTGHDDTLDAVYWMLMVAQGHLMQNYNKDELRIDIKQKVSPFKGIGEHVGYGS